MGQDPYFGQWGINGLNPNYSQRLGFSPLRKICSDISNQSLWFISEIQNLTSKKKETKVKGWNEDQELESLCYISKVKVRKSRNTIRKKQKRVKTGQRNLKFWSDQNVAIASKMRGTT